MARRARRRQQRNKVQNRKLHKTLNSLVLFDAIDWFDAVVGKNLSDEIAEGENEKIAFLLKNVNVFNGNITTKGGITFLGGGVQDREESFERLQVVLAFKYRFASISPEICWAFVEHCFPKGSLLRMKMKHVSDWNQVQFKPALCQPSDWKKYKIPVSVVKLVWAELSFSWSRRFSSSTTVQLGLDVFQIQFQFLMYVTTMVQKWEFQTNKKVDQSDVYEYIWV